MDQLNHEVTMNLKDFDYDILETPSIEDLTKEVIKRLKRKNEKINFLAFHFAQDLRQLPPGMFTDDHGDNESSLTYVFVSS